MDTSVFFSLIHQYWGQGVLAANGLIVAHLICAMILGLFMGYERAFQGRAAGMRTYGLVCTASCALTVIVGYPGFWFGGAAHGATVDPTRVIQGIVTGIGFLCSAVIIKDGFSISGLSTAASIWSCSAIGVLVGVGFYSAAITLTALSVCSMLFLAKFESSLPQKRQVVVKLKFKADFDPHEGALRQAAANRGYSIPENGISVTKRGGCVEWSYTAGAMVGALHVSSITELSAELSKFDGVEEFSVNPMRS